MLARQRPWQARGRASAEEGKDGPWSPRNLGNTRRLLRLARVISAPAAARRVQAQLRKEPVLPAPPPCLVDDDRPCSAGGQAGPACLDT